MRFAAKKKFTSTNPSLAAWIEQLMESNSSVAGGSYMQFTVHKGLAREGQRGRGLFLLVILYDVFLIMEMVLRQFIKAMPNTHGLDKDKVIRTLLNDNEVQF